MSLDSIRIVLVNTSHPGNIGAVARAMKNMGISDLALVEPRKFPHDEATWRAASANDILEAAQIFATLEEAIADCGLVVGTSARGRTIPWPLLDPRHCAEQAYAETRRHKVALVFGREDRGLTNEELQQCNLHVNIPANEEYSSLNLGMAVQVLCYELRMAHLSGDLSADPLAEWDLPPATPEALARYFDHLEETLLEMGFLNPKAPKQLMTRLRRLYTRARPDEMEVNILRGILTSTQYQIREQAAKTAATKEPEA
ncbi:RNA methyltransferase, TrmH family, group 1 [Spongiibacter sp. IMCC21906]|uniref:tRNA (cytosine(32)/uridine(32)-2'-O)-methyltransferase TrmJ n=1 Tax=Spongiibacter sp. IMCC21906 TaxID=1620392 RepID=UPI00062DCBA0|nr:tRNA (cytosine(32)/uridine(32)-2'-O)-methyltransferase TrmJ [Spongiibacter sp. IMCC21906]AKH70263.1 RNA methyltransferase, TrmH family, group 1 [Spongiibacter sp. IMCC21906]